MGFLDKVRNGLKKDQRKSDQKYRNRLLSVMQKLMMTFWKIWRWFFSPVILAYAPLII